MKQKLLIVDGSHMLFRAWFGSYMMRNNGKVNASVSLYLNMLDKVLSIIEPDQTVIVFDCAGTNFRHVLLPTYKANRPKRDDLMVKEEKIIHELLIARGFHLLMVPGIEGDDLAGTIAVQFAKQSEDHEVVIHTEDKDYFQLVNDQLKISIFSGKHGHIDEQQVLAKTKVRVKDIPLYLALMGDSADNILGIKNIGPVTAAQWVNKQLSLEELAKGIQKDSTELSSDEAMLTRIKLNVQLTTIQTDLELASLDFKPKKIDENLQALYGKYKIFNRWDHITPPAL